MRIDDSIGACKAQFLAVLNLRMPIFGSVSIPLRSKNTTYYKGFARATPGNCHTGAPDSSVAGAVCVDTAYLSDSRIETLASENRSGRCAIALRKHRTL